jgi:hypothetical protein
MTSPRDNRYILSHRRGRTLSIMLVGAVAALLIVGVMYSSGDWGADSTATGAGAPSAQLPPGAGPNSGGVPNAEGG